MLAEADSGLTAMAMEGQRGRYNGDEFLLVKFFTHPKVSPVKSAEAGRPIFIETPYIQIMQPGNKDSIIIRPATDMDKQRFAEHYRKYEARDTEEHVEGTLLEEWPGITRSQCEELKFLNIRTVEQLANVNDSNAQGVMGIGFLKQKATGYLAASKDSAVTDALAGANKKLEAMQARLDAMEADATTVADLAAVADEPAEEAEDKPRRRRGAK